MADPIDGKTVAQAPAVEDESFRHQLSMMRRAFMDLPLRNILFALGGGMVAVIVATAFGQVLLNRWNQPFYDALSRRDLSAFMHQLMVFAEIAGMLLVLNITQTWISQMLHVRLREGLTLDLIGEWMRPRRAFRLANAGAIGVNPDQRLHEDAHHLADLSASLGIGLVQSTILLASFVGVLWALSSGFVFHISGHDIAIPGYMVWAAVIYAGTASLLSWLVGRPLIRLNGDLYAREAELRFSLMRVNEHVDAISLAAGEADEKRRLEIDLQSVIAASRRIISAIIRLTWVTSGYGWITVVAPIVIAAPVYFAGDLTFGGLMMAVGAFNQVHAALRWFVDNIGGIADWRATLLRVAAFRSALLKVDELHDVEKRIAFTEVDAGHMTFDDVEVASPGSCTKLADAHLDVGPGERIVVTGDPGAGKTLFFRAIAGLWPWGSGSIGLPKGETVAFIPRTPYFPPGSLRDVLCYPRGTADFAHADLAAALTRIGLARLVAMLDHVARWDRELNDEEQRLLAFARLGLHKPRWVVIDEALDTLGGDVRSRVFSVLEKDLAGAAIINIGLAERNSHFFGRVVHLAADPKGHTLRPFRQGNVAALRSPAALEA